MAGPRKERTLMFIVGLALLAIIRFGRDHAPAPDWRPFSSPEGSFSILMPGEPEAKQEDVLIPGAGTTRMKAWRVGLGRTGGQYAVSVADIIGMEMTDTERLDGLVEGVMKTAGGVLIESEDFELEGRSAREFRYTIERNGKTWWCLQRAAIKSGKVVQANAVFVRHANDEQMRSEDIAKARKFVESLRLK